MSVIAFTSLMAAFMSFWVILTKASSEEVESVRGAVLENRRKLANNEQLISQLKESVAKLNRTVR